MPRPGAALDADDGLNWSTCLCSMNVLAGSAAKNRAKLGGSVDWPESIVSIVSASVKTKGDSLVDSLLLLAAGASTGGVQKTSVLLPGARTMDGHAELLPLPDEAAAAASPSENKGVSSSTSDSLANETPASSGR